MEEDEDVTLPKVKYDYDVQRTTTIFIVKKWCRFDSNSKQPAHYVLDKLIIIINKCTQDQDPEEFLSYHFITL